MQHLSMAITKASRDKETGDMRLRLVNSDTGEDSFGERMSLELFEDFVRRSDTDLPVPAPFDEVIHEDGWEGGKPYLSIAHYKSGAGNNVPGEQEKLYVDGEKLKSVDILHNNELGNAVWKSVYNDLYAEEKEFENPVRVSIGFLDLAHKHVVEDGVEVFFERTSLEDKCDACEDGIGGKVYLKGHLVHKAFTRVPAHPRTDVEIEMKSDAIFSKEDDAKSIIGDIELTEKSRTKDDLIVVKSDVDLEAFARKVRSRFYDEFVKELWVLSVTENYIIVEEYSSEGIEANYKVSYTEKDGIYSFAERSDWEKVDAVLTYVPVKSKATDVKWEYKFEKSETAIEADVEVNTMETPKDETIEEQEVTEETPEVEEPVVEEPSVVLSSAGKIEAKLKELAEKGIYGDDARAQIQPLLNEFGKTLDEEVAPKGELGNVNAVVKSAVAEVVPEIVSQVVSQLSQYVQVPEQQVQKASTVPQPRSLQVQKSVTPQNERKFTQIEQLARKGLLE